jgi:hypothetical protein
MRRDAELHRCLVGGETRGRKWARHTIAQEELGARLRSANAPRRVLPTAQTPGLPLAQGLYDPALDKDSCGDSVGKKRPGMRNRGPGRGLDLRPSGNRILGPALRQGGRSA